LMMCRQSKKCCARVRPLSPNARRVSASPASV